ncbi:serine hydrolase [Streptosporangium amethystogenes]|uniref:serine hydrolase n=1 Tax=Streptosporangium amethystogenes TaxID=2002 RepID=UPI000691FA4B|nr:serine hydrolase [Streptosporangium amethystogenes]
MANDLVGDLRDIVERERARFEVPGCAVLVVADGRIVLCEGFGLRDLARNLPVTPRTLFPIASSTKTFTAALCAVLVNEGALAWDRPVREYLPDFRMRDPVATEQLTVFDMLCHRSGLPRHDMLWYAARDELTRAQIVARLRDLEPNRGFRQTWQYNNLLYAVAGELAGHVAGTSYEDAVRRYLLDPLDMPRTNFSVDVTRADDDAATPYVSASPGEPVKDVPHARLDLIAPAGALNSSVGELAPWLLTLLGLPVDGRPPLLPESVLSLMRAPAAPLPEDSPLAAGRPVGYGLGLIVEDYRGHRLAHHGGNIDGFSSKVGAIPEAGCGVVVLANRDGTALRDALPCLIYDRLLDLAPRSHGERFLALETAVRQGRDQSARYTTSTAGNLAPVRPPHDYVGRYRHPAYGEVAVLAEGDGLAGRYRSLTGRLDHRHLEVFTFLVDLGGVETPLPVQFFHDLDGDVTAMAVSLEAAVAPIRFERVPETAHLTDTVLNALCGTYRLGPLTATVARRADGPLVAMIAQGDFQELKPVRDLVFRFDQSRVEFTGEGELRTPMGEFIRSE